ncbi:hypothetical protein DL764_008816 [Monosporascus ibericus]|uniref:Uncharacterized protein n=1 Tax=Monosporascus ibericus TaxID=155417 RepID=A0A4Q4SWK6_9PEZI|nr:hypothetical protein DL764_008816 [Monosporascus ibericus]
MPKNEIFNSGTDPTDINLFDDDDKGVENVDADGEDQTRLFAGNVHLPEYYRQGIKKFDEDAFDNGYSLSITEQLDSIENQ